MRIAQAAGPRCDRGRHGKVEVLLAGSVLTAAMAVTSASSGATNLQMFEWTNEDSTNTATWSDGGTSYSGSFSSSFASPSNVDYTTLSWLSGYTFTPTAASNAIDISDGAALTLNFTGDPVDTGLVLFVNNLGAGEGFQIGGSLTPGADFSVLGKAGTVTQSGNTFTATGTDEFSNGFAIQLNVPISQLNFNLTQLGTTVTFGIGLQAAASGVPGAGLAGLATLGLAGISRRRRR